jgi:hypothetical protein
VLSFLFREKGSRRLFVSTLLQAFYGVDWLAPSFFYSRKVAIMAKKNDKQCGRISRKAAMVMMKEYSLLLDEMAMMLEEKLLPAQLLKKQSENTLPNQDDFRSLLEFAIRLLKPKSNRNFKEDAILAYAEKRLRELGEKRELSQKN